MRVRSSLRSEPKSKSARRLASRSSGLGLAASITSAAMVSSIGRLRANGRSTAKAPFSSFLPSRSRASATAFSSLLKSRRRRLTSSITKAPSSTITAASASSARMSTGTRSASATWKMTFSMSWAVSAAMA